MWGRARLVRGDVGDLWSSKQAGKGGKSYLHENNFRALHRWCICRNQAFHFGREHYTQVVLTYLNPRLNRALFISVPVVANMKKIVTAKARAAGLLQLPSVYTDIIKDTTSGP